MQPDMMAKKIRENLESQKSKLEEYLKLLDSEKVDLEEQNADHLLTHINLEKDIINDLVQFKKILEPLESYYTDLPFKKDRSLVNLKASIDKLSIEVKERSQTNKIKLESVIDQVKLNLSSFGRTKVNRSPYQTVNPGILDISG